MSAADCSLCLFDRLLVCKDNRANGGAEWLRVCLRSHRFEAPQIKRAEPGDSRAAAFALIQGGVTFYTFLDADIDSILT